MPKSPLNLWYAILPTVLFGFIGWLIGGLWQQWAWGLVIGLILYQSYFLFVLQRFGHWITRHVHERPPNFGKNLDIMANHLYQANRHETQAHQQTIQLVQKIRTSLAELEDAVILIDNKDCIEWWNPAAEMILNLKSADQGRHILTLSLIHI